MKKEYRLTFSLKMKLILLLGISVFMVTLLLSYFSWRQNYQNLEERFGLVLKHIAINTSLNIDGAGHSKILKNDDLRLPEFEKTHDYMQKVMKANYLTPETFYTFNITEDHKLKFAVMLHKTKFIGDIYTPPEFNRQYFEKVMQGKPTFTQIYEDEHGHWISGLSPIWHNDKVIGVVEADFRIEKFLDELYRQTLELILYSVAIMLASMAAAVFLGTKISRPIRELRDSAIRIVQGDLNFSLKVYGRDEIAELRKSFNQMLRSLNEKLLMMKYISPHTKRMIELQIQEPDSGTGQLRETVILFSDIRGFTSFSEKRSPQIVIRNLNTILAKQSEIIEKFGGDIDKFVGDQVIAVFDGPAAAKLAVNCAIEIQQMIISNKVNPEFDESLTVGIGIVAGEVVMGNIGSRDRKDFTLIGSTVNLGARICNAAKSFETLVTARIVQQYAAEENNKIFEKKGLLSAKGFSERIPVYSVLLAENSSPLKQEG